MRNEEDSREMWTYSRGKEMRDTATTTKSRMLNRLRQNDPLCNTSPYVIICNHKIKINRSLIIIIINILWQHMFKHKSECGAKDFN